MRSSGVATRIWSCPTGRVAVSDLAWGWVGLKNQDFKASWGLI